MQTFNMVFLKTITNATYAPLPLNQMICPFKKKSGNRENHRYSWCLTKGASHRPP